MSSGARLGEDAMRIISRYGSHDLDLHRLELSVAAFNALMGLLRDDSAARDAARA